YFYEPSQAQVTVFEKFEDSPLWSALQFLWGQGSLGEFFQPVACDAHCPKVEDAQVVLALRPHESVAAVKHVYLVVDQGSKQVSRSVVIDSLGNKSEYIFKSMSFGKPIPESRFVFAIPKGVSVL